MRKRYDPLTHRYPRTTVEAFGFSPYAIELPHEPSLFRWWSEVVAAVAVVLTCVIIVRAVV